MTQLTQIIEHIQTILSSEELRTLCFVLYIDTAPLESSNRIEFANNLLSYLQKANQLNRLLDESFLSESMAQGLPPETIRQIELHDTMMSHCDRETVSQICDAIPLVKWRKFAQLDIRDLYREVIHLATRRGYLSDLEEAVEKASNMQANPIHATNHEAKILNSKSDLITWMKEQASHNDLAHLAFLMGKNFENFPGSNNIEIWIDEFVAYYEKRQRLDQLLIAQKKILN